MELYTVVERREYNPDHIELYHSNIICDSLKLAKQYASKQIKELEDNFIKGDITFIIFKYKLNELGRVLVEEIYY